MSPNLPEHIILFDGVCTLCNRSVQTVLRHDKRGTFHYASLQSALGQQLLTTHGLAGKNIDSIVYVCRDRAYIKSSAALRIAQRMSGLYPLLSVFLLVPAFIRNIGYDWVARNRYRWFGTQESCMMASPELKARFLDTTPAAATLPA